MYIREHITTIKGIKYIKHSLVESYRTIDNKVRQRIIMNLGTLDVPKNRWKELAFLLEQNVLGQQGFNILSPDLKKIADDLYARAEFTKKKPEIIEEIDKKADFVKINLNSIQTSTHRSCGNELLANKMWNDLCFDEILEKCNFNNTQISYAKALIIGKLINPTSELSTWKWFNNQTALTEMTKVDIQGRGKDFFYEIADLLFKNKNIIENELYKKETTLFSLERKLFLFDLTNTYLEGSAKGNGIAKRGKSKEKRSDCKLIAFALMVDEKGFPVYSKIYKGNQSEPETLLNVLEELINKEEIINNKNKPVLIMDRGIATKKNIELIKANNFSYVIIERKPKQKEYQQEFEELKDIVIKENYQKLLNEKKWFEIEKEKEVYVKKIELDNVVNILTFSKNKELKEESMNSLKEKRFIEDIEKLQKSIKKGTIKLINKVTERLGKIKQKYIGITKIYDLQIIPNEKQEIKELIITKKKEEYKQKSILTGCYVIESDITNLSAEEIWKIYITITKVEAAFQDLKAELGLRPIYHQNAERTQAHIFITVLAYHLLVGIENILRENGDKREYKTIKEVLKTHQRSTVILQGENNTIYNIRVTGNPEDEQKKIYNYFNIKDFLRKSKTKIERRL